MELSLLVISDRGRHLYSQAAITLDSYSYNYYNYNLTVGIKLTLTRMWAYAQYEGRPGGALC